MNITSRDKVGEIAARHPMATQVFSRHGIDFCCGGGVELQEACTRQGLSTPEVLGEIEQALSVRDSDLVRWDEAPAADLIRHIVQSYHLPLREELPRLESMARKVARVHGDKDPERLGDLLQTFLGLKVELDDHMDREEEHLFPAIQQHGGSDGLLISDFIDDHTEAGQALARLRELTGDYRVPDGACNTWRALWHGLEALERSLHLHIHLENNVLFPKLGATNGVEAPSL